MKYDGTTYYRCTRYHWRYKRPGDLDGSGEPVHEDGSYIVIYDRNDPTKAQSHYLRYTNTGGGYTMKVRVARVDRYMGGPRPSSPEVFVRAGERFLEMRLFQAHDGRLYSTTQQYMPNDPSIIEVFAGYAMRLKEAIASKNLEAARA